jgi:predicted nuclease with RNAse H fold
MTISNTPVLANITIIIDSKDSVPVVTTDSPLSSNEKVWQINMSQDTYNANAKCLRGISVKNAH